MAEEKEQPARDEYAERQLSGRCWNCGEPKKNPYGLCNACGTFGLSENEIGRRLDPEKMRTDIEHNLNRK